MNKKIFWGTLFLLLAIFLVLVGNRIIKINLFFDGWWAVYFVVIPGVVGATLSKDPLKYMIVAAIGVVLCLTSVANLSFEKYILVASPMVVAFIGMYFVMTGCDENAEIKRQKQLEEAKKKKKDLKKDAFDFGNLDVKSDELKKAFILKKKLESLENPINSDDLRQLVEVASVCINDISQLKTKGTRKAYEFWNKKLTTFDNQYENIISLLIDHYNINKKFLTHLQGKPSPVILDALIETYTENAIKKLKENKVSEHDNFFINDEFEKIMKEFENKEEKEK